MQLFLRKKAWVFYNYFVCEYSMSQKENCSTLDQQMDDDANLLFYINKAYVLFFPINSKRFWALFFGSLPPPLLLLYFRFIHFITQLF